MKSPYDIFAVVADSQQRIVQLEGSLRSALHGAAMAENGKLPEGTEIGGVAIGGTIGPPQNLSAVSGALFDQIYVDLEFDPPLVGDAVSYTIEVAEDLGLPSVDFWRNFQSSSTTPRIMNLMPGVDYVVRVAAVNVLGAQSDFTDWVQFTAAIDSTVPASPTGLNLFGGLRTITAVWNDNSEQDVARGAGQYELQIDVVNTFDEDPFSYFTTGSIIAVSNLNPGSEYFGRVRAIDSSGNESGWSEIDSTILGQATADDIGNGVIVTDHIATAGLDAAVIKFGEMSGDRIEANTLDANRIVTSELTAADITLNGGSIKIDDPPNDGLIINALGIRAYKATVPTLVVDSSGDVTVTGVFQTGSSGQRIIIRDAPGGLLDQSFIEFHPEIEVEAPATITSTTFEQVGFIWSDIFIGPPIPTGEYEGMGIRFSSREFNDVSPQDRRAEITFSCQRINLQKYENPDYEFLPGVSWDSLLVPTIEGQSFTAYFNRTEVLVGRFANRMLIGLDTVPTINVTSGTSMLAQPNDWLAINPRANNGNLGLVVNDEAWVGRQGNLLNNNALFTHVNTRGSVYGLVIDSDGNASLSGWDVAQLKRANDGDQAFNINSGGMALRSPAVNLPLLVQTAGAGNVLIVNSSGYVFEYTSSLRNKTEVLSVENDDDCCDSSVIYQLQPSTFRSTVTEDHAPDDPTRRYIGLIAEWTHEVEPELAVVDQNGQPTGINWPALQTLMLAEIQRLHQRVTALEEQ